MHVKDILEYIYIYTLGQQKPTKAFENCHSKLSALGSRAQRQPQQFPGSAHYGSKQHNLWRLNQKLSTGLKLRKTWSRTRESKTYKYVTQYSCPQFLLVLNHSAAAAWVKRRIGQVRENSWNSEIDDQNGRFKQRLKRAENDRHQARHKQYPFHNFPWLWPLVHPLPSGGIIDKQN